MSETLREASRDDVVECYRTFLNREPESAARIDEHLADRPSLWELIRRFAASQEAVRLRVSQACALIERGQDGRGVEVDVEGPVADELTRHIETVWSKYGREEAYFSVLTNPRYLSENLDADEVCSFYSTGREDVSFFEDVCRRNFVEPEKSWTVLELGCGVGRVGEHFAREFAFYMGVDISSEHLKKAQGHFGALGFGNTKLIELKDYFASNEAFDIFYSIIVLQHNPPPIIYSLLDASFAKLNAGGYAFFQTPCFLYDYSFKASAYLAGEGKKDEMEMHFLPQRQIFELFSKHGMTPIEVFPDSRIGPTGFSYSFFARKDR